MGEAGPGLDPVVQEAAGRLTDPHASAGAVLHGSAHFELIHPKGLKTVDYL
ncbi:MAG: hypothetical protein ACTHK3_01390 [Solirubrobacterales bacterium]